MSFSRFFSKWQLFRHEGGKKDASDISLRGKQSPALGNVRLEGLPKIMTFIRWSNPKDFVGVGAADPRRARRPAATHYSSELCRCQRINPEEQCHCEECNDEAICSCRLEIATGFRPRNDSCTLCQVNNSVILCAIGD